MGNSSSSVWKHSGVTSVLFWKSEVEREGANLGVLYFKGFFYFRVLWWRIIYGNNKYKFIINYKLNKLNKLINKGFAPFDDSRTKESS